MEAIQNITPLFNHAKKYPGFYILPLIKENPPQIDEYPFVWEGLDEQSLQIEEQESSNVPTVTVHNKSPKYFLGYRGEVIRGGGQNRQLLHSFIMDQNCATSIPVQCVQQGRWNPHENKQFTSKSGDITSSTLRHKKKSQHETWQTITHLTTLTATTSVTQDQTIIRDFLCGSDKEAASSTISMSATTPQGQTIRTAAREKAQKILHDYETPLPNQVGIYTIMVDPETSKPGEEKFLQSIEVFHHPHLYKKVHKDLISSFVMDIATVDSDIAEKGEKSYQEFIDRIGQTSWQDKPSIGKELRKEINADDIFGEAIFINEQPVHIMCSS